ncbi:MAG: ubiquinone/menaquinone biosynthesis methyltransferase [Planctomycetota bacterium]|nr:bifunctional demethylmenaquinone methyltransferase/2-methoxy-6-polyprenyl-1,4-benzoquinol methylase [Planctomycetota bacterium]MEE2711269.1 ubiquinone/menaquinone biosynthesis methyltransferase [Planctomycetota bacterium]
MTGDEVSAGTEAAPGWELTGTDRERYVERMFDGIAKPYDRLNRVISLGRDRRWRAVAVEMSGVRAGDNVADVGCGTGDLAFDFARAVGESGRVVGLDLSPGMLQVATAKHAASDVPWLSLHRANAAATGLPDAWADVVGMGWVLRNVGDRAPVYKEIQRILRPGGRFVCIDMSRPGNPVSRLGNWMYRHLAMPVLARFSGGDRSAYRYLASSTDHFPDGPDLAAELAQAGFKDVTWRSLMLGSLAVHVATTAPVAGMGRA